MKKFIIILLFIITLGAGVAGTWYFYDQNQNWIEQNAQLMAQNSQVQAQLNAIGSMGTVYQTSTRVYSGKEIKDTDLIEVSIPISAMGESTITDKSLLVGQHYKVDIKPGTILTYDLLMSETADNTRKKFQRALNFTSLPVGIVENDYVDIRLMLPNGEEFVVFSHIQVKSINETTLLFDISEEDNVIINSMIQDASNYAGYCVFYLMKYLEPGYDTDTVAFYPVQHEMENFVRWNPNIDDTTRCINSELRDHIDKVLLMYTSGDNGAVASSFISGLSGQYSSQLSMHEEWIEQHTDEEGNLVVEGTDNSGGQSFDQEVGEAMDSLENSLEDLEAIQ